MGIFVNFSWAFVLIFAENGKNMSKTEHKSELMEELSDIGAGKDPLSAAIEKFNQSSSKAERNKLRLRIERMMLDKGAGGNRSTRSSDVEKALAYLRGEEIESGKVSERYLALASGEDIMNDARIRAAKSRIKQYSDEYKRLLDEGRTSEAQQYRSAHAKWFAAESLINSQQRGIASNKKLLGKGYDTQIMKLISSQRERILKIIEGLE